MQESYFVPLDKNKNNWDLSKKIVFLDKFFELELDDVDKSTVQYDILPSCLSKISENEINSFENELISFFKEKFNAYHNVNFDYMYWKKMFSGWLRPFIINCYDKIELLLELKDSFPGAFFESTVQMSSEDGVLFSKLAKKICDFSIICLDDFKTESSEKQLKKENVSLLGIIINTYKRFISKIMRFKFRNIKVYVKNIVNRLIQFVIKIYSSHNGNVLIGYSYIPWSSIRYFKKKK